METIGRHDPLPQTWVFSLRTGRPGSVCECRSSVRRGCTCTLVTFATSKANLDALVCVWRTQTRVPWPAVLRAVLPLYVLLTCETTTSLYLPIVSPTDTPSTFPTRGAWTVDTRRPGPAREVHHSSRVARGRTGPVSGRPVSRGSVVVSV